MINAIGFWFDLTRFRRRGSWWKKAEFVHVIPGLFGPSKPHPCRGEFAYTRRNLFQILVNQTEIRLYLPCIDWFGTANGLVRLLFQINRCMVNTVWFRFDLIRFRKYLSVRGIHIHIYIYYIKYPKTINCAQKISHELHSPEGFLSITLNIISQNLIYRVFFFYVSTFKTWVTRVLK